MALHDAIRHHPVVWKMVNWEKFAEYAESVGLHYDPRLGIMDQVVWEGLSPFLTFEPTVTTTAGPSDFAKMTGSSE